MRTLNFEPGGRAFDLCYHALIFSPLPVQRNELRTHGVILTKLEAIGQVRLPVDKDGAVREFGPDELRLFMCVQGGTVVLEDAEWDFLKRHMDATVPNVNKALSRDLDRALDWLEKIPAELPTPAAQSVEG